MYRYVASPASLGNRLRRWLRIRTRRTVLLEAPEAYQQWERVLYTRTDGRTGSARILRRAADDGSVAGVVVGPDLSWHGPRHFPEPSRDLARG